MGIHYFLLRTKEGNLRAGRATGYLHGLSSMSYRTQNIGRKTYTELAMHCLLEGVRRMQVRKKSWQIILPLPKSEKNIKALHTIRQHEAPTGFQASLAGCENSGFKTLHP